MENDKKLKNIKSFSSFNSIKENTETETQPAVKPAETKPRTTPSPFRRVKSPTIKPKPKATAEDVAKRFMKLKKEQSN